MERKNILGINALFLSISLLLSVAHGETNSGATCFDVNKTELEAALKGVSDTCKKATGFEDKGVCEEIAKKCQSALGSSVDFSAIADAPEKAKECPPLANLSKKQIEDELKGLKEEEDKLQKQKKELSDQIDKLAKEKRQAKKDKRDEERERRKDIREQQRDYAEKVREAKDDMTKAMQESQEKIAEMEKTFHSNQGEIQNQIAAAQKEMAVANTQFETNKYNMIDACDTKAQSVLNATLENRQKLIKERLLSANSMNAIFKRGASLRAMKNAVFDDCLKSEAFSRKLQQLHSAKISTLNSTQTQVSSLQAQIQQSADDHQKGLQAVQTSAYGQMQAKQNEIAELNKTMAELNDDIEEEEEDEGEEKRIEAVSKQHDQVVKKEKELQKKIDEKKIALEAAKKWATGSDSEQVDVGALKYLSASLEKLETLSKKAKSCDTSTITADEPETTGDAADPLVSPPAVVPAVNAVKPAARKSGGRGAASVADDFSHGSSLIAPPTGAN